MRKAGSVRKVTGVVNWFNEQKGYGFIAADDGSKDVFVHFSAIEREGFQTLRAGQYVEYDTVQDPKGPRARQVRVIAGPGPDAEDESTPQSIGYAIVFSHKGLQVVELFSDGALTVLHGEARFPAFLHFSVSGKLRRLLNAIEELEWFINRPDTTEAQIQKFFERNPDFLLGTEYNRIHPRIVLEKPDGGSLIPDFFLEPLDSPELCDIVDLKLPREKLTVAKKNRRRFAHSVWEVAAQLREYRDFFDDPRNRNLVKRRYKISAYKPSVAVIIGRSDDTVSAQQMQAIRADLKPLRVLTYDQIVSRGRQLVKRLTE